MSLRDDLIEAGLVVAEPFGWTDTDEDRMGELLDAFLDVLTERCRVVDSTNAYQKEVWLGAPEDQGLWLLIPFAEARRQR